MIFIDLTLLASQTAKLIFDKQLIRIDNIQNAQISQKQDERNIYAVMKKMCLPGYHHNGFVATHALGHMMCGWN